MNKNNRDYFDRQVEWVLERLPRKVLRLLMDVPLHVEDQPTKRLMEEMKIADSADLCGCFSGVPFNAVSVFGHLYASRAVPLPNNITIFRRGIVAASRNEWGRICRNKLRRQIRITILHELAHLHGMEEDEIAEIGYG
jgi:predicted Zn-dependent protease with MMP-like domain